MEKNIEVRVLQTYLDLELGCEIERTKTMWLTEERAKILLEKGLVKILQIVRKRCINE